MGNRFWFSFDFLLKIEQQLAKTVELYPAERPSTPTGVSKDFEPANLEHLLHAHFNGFHCIKPKAVVVSQRAQSLVDDSYEAMLAKAKPTNSPAISRVVRRFKDVRGKALLEVSLLECKNHG